MQNNNIAVIDVGSNSVRYMLYNSSVLVNTKLVNSTVLGEGLAINGYLKQEAILRAANAINQYVLLAKKSNANKIFIFATEAVRTAKNSVDFTDLVFAQTNTPVDVISGALEAQIGFMGACSICKSSATVIDIGGASVEIIRGNKGKIEYEKSLPLGLVRLYDLLGNDRQKIHEYIAKKIVDYGNVGQAKNIIAIGGTSTSVASIVKNQKIYDAQQTHNTIVTLDNLLSLENRIFTSDNITRDFPTISLQRARIIGHGVIMLVELLYFLNCKKIKVSELDNMEGYIMYKNNV